MEYSIGIDIGGTKIAAGVVSKSGQILCPLSVPTPQTGRQDVYQALAEIITQLTQFAEQNDLQELMGIGIGTPGQIDFATGTVLAGTTNIADWSNVPLRQEIGKFTSFPLWVDNDVNLVVLAEKYLGAGQRESDIVVLTLGTGVGGGVISGGQLLRGSWGGAAELGHVSVNMNGPECKCGLRGCLEAYASGTAIAQLMQEKLAATVASDKGYVSLSASVNHPVSITSHDVFKLYQAGDKFAQEVIGEAITALSFAIVNAIHTFNPAIVILGGGIMRDGEWILNEVKKKVNTIGIRSLVDPVRIEIAQLGAEAGLIGAAYQVWAYNQPVGN